MFRLVRTALTLMLLMAMGACSLFQARDPLAINVIGIDPLPGQDLELRMAVRLRVQNPNETPIEFNGISLKLEVNGQPLAAGVSDQQGSIGRYGERVLVVPVSITAFSFLRQAVGLGRMNALEGMPYVVHGKLAGGVFGTVRFTDEGRLALPKASDEPW